MFRDKDKNLRRLEKELLAEESQEQFAGEEESSEEPEAEYEDGFSDGFQDAPEVPADDPVTTGKRPRSRLMKLSITALCLLGGILLVLLYWLVRFL